MKILRFCIIIIIFMKFNRIVEIQGRNIVFIRIYCIKHHPLYIKYLGEEARMMMKQEEFSIVTDKYLSCFNIILDKMIMEMCSAEVTDSISYNFIVQMIPHHKAAIEMSCNILQYTTLVPLQNIALNIIEEQTESIENMKSVMNCCGMLCNTEMDNNLYMCLFNDITHTMFHGMRNAYTTNNINANFMREMIPHHRGAIQMSENALQFPICQDLQPIIRSIITSQQSGIRKMECLLRHMCNK